MPRQRVFVIEQTDFDLTPAEDYGEIIYLRHTRLSPFDDNAEQHIRDALQAQGFQPETDLICLTGKVTSVAYFLAMAVSWYKTVRLLVFDARSGAYRQRDFNPARGVEAHGSEHSAA